MKLESGLITTMTEAQDAASWLYRAHTNSPKAARTLMRAFRVADYLPKKNPLAAHAFFGGRVQIFRTGKFAGPLYRYDMRSAYPAALVEIIHRFQPHIRAATNWPEIDRETPYAYRESDGSVSYPPHGRTWAWTWDVRRQYNGHNPFGYLRDLYALSRETEGAEFAAWLKQTMRCTWGSLLLPGFECYSLEWAGLCTQIVHDWIYWTVMRHRDPGLLLWNVDSVVSTRRLRLRVGEGLGEWALTVLDGLEINPGQFGPGRGHPEPGSDRWCGYWPPDDYRDWDAPSTPYRYQGPNQRREHYETQMAHRIGSLQAGELGAETPAYAAPFGDPEA